MSIYQFAPANTFTHNHPFITWDDAFTEEEIESIKSIGLSLPMTNAFISDQEDADCSEIRRSRVSWIANNNDNYWIYDKLAFVARSINSKFFDFDLFGFLEDMQFTEYVGESKGHYTWHQDLSEKSPGPRKLSLVLQLSDPADYEGGELQTMGSSEPSIVDKKKGLITAFPSWALHRVTPITSGTRHTLVVWVSGPSFK
jgi:PKHD-type hydroxylase